MSLDSSSSTPRPTSPVDANAGPSIPPRSDSDLTIVPSLSPPLRPDTATPSTDATAVITQAALGRGAPPPEETDLASSTTTFTTSNPTVPMVNSSPNAPRTSKVIASGSRNPSQMETELNRPLSALSQQPNYATTSPHTTEMSETGSLLSTGEMSDSNYEYYAERERDKASRGVSSGGGNRGKGKKVAVGARSGSIASPARTGSTIGRGQVKGRSLTPRQMSENSDEEGGDEGNRDRGKDTSLLTTLPLLGVGARASTLIAAGAFDEDDEVLRRDRGEELVRKRMRDRARVKKETEKANRKRDQEERLARTRAVTQVPPQSRRTSFNPTSYLSDTEPAETSTIYDRSASTSHPGRAPLLRRNTEGVERSGYFSQDDYDQSIAGTERGFLSPPGSPLLSPRPAQMPLLRSPSTGGAPLLRGFSHTSALSEASADISAVEDVDGASSIGDRAYDNAGEEQSVGDEEEIEEDDEEESEENDGEVEYTLKDRQDAINIEHPFGLPIWKPALYKKSRSVTRNAETALHATPSAVALQHLAPVNILWTLFFGSWLFVICTLVSGVLWITPWGGNKYGRVLWELGGYLFWPFGKYIEGWSDSIEGEEDNGYEDLLEQEDEENANQFTDVEDAGKTFGRSRARMSTNQSDGANDLGHIPAASVFDNNLPDEPRRKESSHSQLVQTSYGSQSNNERSALLRKKANIYGTVPEDDKNNRSSSESTIAPQDLSHSSTTLHNFNGDDNASFRVRALGRTMYWAGFYLIIAPLMLIVCILCWAMVFTVPMAKLLWVLLRHLANEPLSLHFRSPPKYSPTTGDKERDANPTVDGIQFPLRAGQPAPPLSKKSVAAAKAQGRIFGPRSTVLLCTYQAAGLQYYKYTVDGVNIMFINLLSLVFFVIADDWYLRPYVESHALTGVLAFITGQGFIFVIALLSVIPLSYFIGMAVASISAQSSIGMGAVINASFGSIIEIILYCIALTQGKSELVEGSIVGSILAAVLLMPGLSMIGGAMRRKEQKFNAKSAGVTSTMLIMAIIGILTPTLFYEIYGSFQLTCFGCDPAVPGGTTSSCKSCYYEHIDPVDDPFYKNTVKLLSYYCAAILVLSYLVGLWFSLRTHASQIWQNVHELPTHVRPITIHQTTQQIEPRHPSLVKRSNTSTTIQPRRSVSNVRGPSTSSNVHHKQSSELVSNSHHEVRPRSVSVAPPMTRATSHVREASAVKNKEEEEDQAGGHDAPNWSRVKSASVLMGCTVLYAIIAEILVDVVDVVLDGSGIPEKLLGVTLFALVPNTTEFMNAISFAINGNIALSMEIGSAYALQVCLIQAPAMLAFTAYYSIGKESMIHKAFTLVFPRWDVIAIIFSVFLLTYVYIEARANYYRGTILCLAYMVLLGGFVFAPGGRDTEDNPIFTLSNSVLLTVQNALGLI